MRKGALFILGLAWLLCQALAADPAPYKGVNSQGLTQTIQVDELSIRLSDVLVEPKEGYVFLLWDAFPYRVQLPGLKDGDKLEKVVAALVKEAVLAKYPRASTVKADVVEYSERDDYGAPIWDKVHILARFDARIRHGKVKLKKLGGEGTVH